MQSKISLKWQLLVIGIAGIASCSITIFFLTLGLPDQDSYTPQNLTGSKSVQSINGSGLPARLKIPAINVDAAIEHVGLTSDGAMDVPKGPAGVAWYKLGPRPGQRGSAVISGHYGWQNRIPAVFDNLHTLQKGDKLYVEDEKGVTTTFVVRESRSYDPNADGSSVFFSNDGKTHLNLVTCEGVWDEAQKSYPSRLVVFTDKEIE